MARTCLRCGATYPDSAAFCARDGAALFAAASSDDLIGELFCDRYVVTDLLGEGGMATVYAARDVRLPQQVAIKVLREKGTMDPAVVQRFRQEAEAASRINHDRVARVTDFGFRTDGQAFLVMEFVDGRTLRQVLDQRGTLPFAETSSIIGMIAEGLQAAHRLGIVHRDLKPDNVMIIEDEDSQRVKVLDFGIAKLLGSSSDALRTAQGFSIGTPSWMSPEQLLGMPLDGRSDIYTLGLMTFAMLTGTRAFAGATENAEMMARLSEPPRTLVAVRPEVMWPNGLQALLDRTLARDPVTRPETALAFARDLRRLIDVGAATIAFTKPVTPRSPFTDVAIAASTTASTPTTTPTPGLAAAQTIGADAPVSDGADAETAADEAADQDAAADEAAATEAAADDAAVDETAADDAAESTLAMAATPMPLSAPVTPTTPTTPIPARPRRPRALVAAAAVVVVGVLAVVLRPTPSTPSTPSTQPAPTAAPLAATGAPNLPPSPPGSTASLPTDTAAAAVRDRSPDATMPPTPAAASPAPPRPSSVPPAAASAKRAMGDTSGARGTALAAASTRRAGDRTASAGASTAAPAGRSSASRTPAEQASLELAQAISDADERLANMDAAGRRARAPELLRTLQALMPRLSTDAERGWAAMYIGTAYAILGETSKACASLRQAGALGGAVPATRTESEELMRKLRCSR